MKKWNGCNTESKKCAFCGRVTSDYVKYEVVGITIQVSSHFECAKDLSDISKVCFRLLKKKIKERR